MPSLTLIGLLIWLFISLVAFAISGSLYYELVNIWIPLIPLSIFFLSYVILLTLRLNNFKNAKTSILSEVAYKKYFIFSDGIEKLTTRIGFFTSVIVLSLLIYTLNNLGVSLTEAQRLRDAFYSQEGMQLMGGAIFIWINWLIMAVVYMIFLSGISIAVTKKHILNRPLLMAIGMLVILSLMTGGRGGIVNVIIFSLGGWLSVAALRELNYKKTIRKFFIIASTFFAILFIQFVNRAEGSELAIINTFVKYFVGPIFAFDQLIVTGVDHEIRSSIGRLGSALIGLDTILISGFARGVLGLQIESALATTSYYFHHGVDISNIEIMNAHYTGGVRWYIDFGLAGYFLFFALLAALCLCVDIKKARLAGGRVTFGYPIIYTCVFVTVIYSTREFMFDSPEYYMAFGGLLVLYAYVKRKSRIFKKICNNLTCT